MCIYILTALVIVYVTGGYFLGRLCWAIYWFNHFVGIEGISITVSENRDEGLLKFLWPTTFLRLIPSESPIWNFEHDSKLSREFYCFLMTIFWLPKLILNLLSFTIIKIFVKKEE